MGPVAAVAIPAAIKGVGELAGAAVGGKGASRAAEAQQRSSFEALNYQRQKDIQDRADKEKDRALAKAAWDASESERIARQAPRRAAIASLYRDRGISLPAVTARQYDPTGVANAEAPSSAQQQPVSLLSLYGGMPAQQAPLTPALPGADAEMTLADFFGRRQTNLS